MKNSKNNNSGKTLNKTRNETIILTFCSYKVIFSINKRITEYNITSKKVNHPRFRVLLRVFFF